MNYSQLRTELDNAMDLVSDLRADESDPHEHELLGASLIRLGQAYAAIGALTDVDLERVDFANDTARVAG